MGGGRKAHGRIRYGKSGALPSAIRADEAEWYRDAVIYEARVRSFYDADGDGLGDFKGLREKLDYLQDLGVTALWLLPFYPSPMRDDGYDTADYMSVNPDVGTIDDFKAFLEEAHRRGIRVITELVLNHTSDQHPWFQRARRAQPGSEARDFYVWSDGAERYKDARIIFKDFELSNWTWDPLAHAYFWHRFYAHQPDLNFDNPKVHEALLSVVDFWFGLGVDGLRLDAVPYLYEREGTNCENLDETHAFLRKLRAHVDERFKGRMLLAEANQWPEDSVAYFGKGDECHMAFHFPIMPRLFMSIHLEDRFPIIDILAQTPALPDGCQWALFLRNHDELTLEMVTDEERDYMYRAYAHDQAMRINLGIRRRLAPLLGNDRRNVELMNGLLFSLPGTPVIYYGDEIGMGDNVFLGDRNGVRTPMQWSSDRNAGFSRANPQRLILPVVIDPEYHFEAVNVEAQQNNPSSLLWWTKRLIAMRKRFQAFGRGSIEFLSPDNAKVLAFIRRHGEEVILVVANLSRVVQFVELDLSSLKGRVPVELFGGNALPAIKETPYLLTLGGRAFYWLSLESPIADGESSRLEGYKPPSVEIAGPWDRALEGAEGDGLAEAIATYLATRPWFSAADPPLGALADSEAEVPAIPTFRVAESIPLAEEEGQARLLIIAVEREGSDLERYFLPLVFETDDRAIALRARAPHAVVAEVHSRGAHGDAAGVLIDPLADAESTRVLLEAVILRGRLPGAEGAIVGRTIQAPRGSSRDDLTAEARSLRVIPHGDVTLFGAPCFLKLFRRLDEGTSPDVELAQFLERAATPFVPRIAGLVEYQRPRGEPVTLAVARAYVENEGDAFTRVVAEISRYFERVLTQRRDAADLHEPTRSPHALSAEPYPKELQELIGSAFLELAELLGKRTAELHLALAGDPRSLALLAPEAAAGEAHPGSMPASFAPEAYSTFDQRSTYQTMRNQAGKVLRALRQKQGMLPPSAAPDAAAVIAAEALVMKRFGAVLDRRVTALRVRYHGDYHLGKVLFTGKDFVLADFNGDTRKPLTDRRRKGTVIRDLATMIRSLHYAVMAGVLDVTQVRKVDRSAAEPWAHLWYTWVAAAFLKGYFRMAEGAVFLPRDPVETEILLDVFLLKKAFNELGFELETRSKRVVIPLRGIVKLLARTPPT
jgi:maltose alpha-D-glucosyltransferase / alpha-amylase